MCIMSGEMEPNKNMAHYVKIIYTICGYFILGGMYIIWIMSQGIFYYLIKNSPTTG